MTNDNWPEIRLADLCDSVDYGYTAAATSSPIGPRLLRITDIISGHIDWDHVPFCEIDEKLKERFRLHPDDIVVARTGATTGVSAFIANPVDAVFASYLIRLKIGKRAHPRFIAYFLKSPQYWAYIRGVLGDKSAQPNANAKTLTHTTLHLPPIAQQTAIAHILGTLDDKIELNRRMNETLEAIARTLFKSWFVDFDPVRAKAEGRQPAGMDAETAALFPDAFEDSPLGESPAGWSVRKVDDVISFTRQSLNPREYPEETFNHHSIPAFDEGRWPKVETGEKIRSNKFLVPPEAVLLSKLNPRFPRVWFPAVGVGGPQRSICSTEFLVALPKSGSSREYVYGLFTSDSFRVVFATLVTGTSSSHQRVRPEDILSVEVVLPNSACLLRFSEITKSFHTLVADNLQQCRTLAATRDTLLPKLLSGEIRVKDAEQAVEHAL